MSRSQRNLYPGSARSPSHTRWDVAAQGFLPGPGSSSGDLWVFCAATSCVFIKYQMEFAFPGRETTMISRSIGMHEKTFTSPLAKQFSLPQAE